MNDWLRLAIRWISVVLALVLGFGCGRSRQDASDAGLRPTPVRVAEVRLAPFEERIEALGTTYARESVEITASVTETIDSIHFEDGQQVEEGALLVTLTQNTELAQLAAARASLAEEQREVNRLEKLVATRAAAQNELDERRTLLTIAKQRILEAEANIRDRTIRAPFRGVLGLRRVSPGALVEPGTVITTLDDTTEIKLDFSVPAQALQAVQVGTPLVARSAVLGDRLFEGQIVAVETRINPRDRSILARARLLNPDGALQPGMLLQVELLASRREALLVPEEALIPLEEKQFVLVVDPHKDNLVERREVTVGARKPGIVEILAGLSQGEWVIVEGLTNVRPGGKVAVKPGSEEKDQGA